MKPIFEPCELGKCGFNMCKGFQTYWKESFVPLFESQPQRSQVFVIQTQGVQMKSYPDQPFRGLAIQSFLTKLIPLVFGGENLAPN